MSQTIENVSQEAQEVKKKLPAHPFFALSVIIGLAFIAAFFIPSGQYERVVVDGITKVDPTSYKQIEKIYPTIRTLFESFFYGFGNVASLMALVLFVGGAFGVIKGIGLFDVTIKAVMRKMKNYGIVPMMIAIMLMMALIISFTGIWELSLVVIPFIIPLCLSLGYDDMTGFAIIMAGNCAALGTALANPFFTAVGHQIAELPIYSGMWYRLITMVVLYIPIFFYVLRYARKVKANPALSITKDDISTFTPIEDDGETFTKRQKIAGTVFLIMFAFLMYGTLAHGFSFPEISAVFVAMSLLVGLSYGKSLNEICYLFANGMHDLMIGAFVMFFARAILYILESTMIIDTVIHALAGFFVGTNELVIAGTVLVVQSIMNFLVPSGSGQAMLTLPILIPLADMGGITRQTIHFASQLGDGLSNILWPTNGALMAMLAVGGISYRKWFKFFAPLFLVILVISLGFVMLAQYIKLGPF